jgi:hypothetical protein
MVQADFHYAPEEWSQDAAGVPMAMCIFADRTHIRDAIRDDAMAAGLRLGSVGDLDLLLGNEARALGDVVFVDCPVARGGVLAALSRLDMRVANSGAQLIVSTSVDALDDVFACLDSSKPQILVDPSRGERVIALGRILTKMPGMRLRDMSDEDRVTMLRLTEQVAQIAQRLEQMDQRGRTADGGAFRFESPNPSFNGANDDASRELVRKPRPPLPDPRLVRQIIRQRQTRARFFAADLFADPAWDILLDLTAARAEHLRVSVTSLCIASGVPPTTALRWINQMVESGLLERVEDETDRRRAFIALSDKAADAMARYFHELGKEAGALV